jgi:pimeloyl-ACP methyl ester carboxylesterase
MPPFVVDKFVETIIKEGARDAFERAYENSTRTQIELEGFQQIQDVPCLLIWGEKDNLIPIEYYEKFKQNLSESKTKNEIIKGAGHAPFVERTALVYDKLCIFLSEDKK